MAEGWARQLHSERFNVWSAGIETHGLNPRAVQVMRERGVDISAHRSKLLDELSSISFDLVITVCGHADTHCPIFPGTTRVVHNGFDDPPRLAKGLRDEEEILQHYRKVCEEIRHYVASL